MIRYKTTETDQICSQYKQWYYTHFPLCGFCFHIVKPGEGDLAHFIRRSASIELQTVKLNTSIAHRSCHNIFDNDFNGALYLPRIIEILYCVYLLDEQYFYQISDHFEPLAEVLQLFPEVEYRDIEHHGQIIQLNYLYYEKIY